MIHPPINGDRSRLDVSRVAIRLKGTSNNDDFFVGSIAGAARR
jgi:hypothetical protein